MARAIRATPEEGIDAVQWLHGDGIIYQSRTVRNPKMSWGEVERIVMREVRVHIFVFGGGFREFAQVFHCLFAPFAELTGYAVSDPDEHEFVMSLAPWADAFGGVAMYVTLVVPGHVTILRVVDRNLREMQ